MSCDALSIRLKTKFTSTILLLCLFCLSAKAQVTPAVQDSILDKEVIKNERGTVVGNVVATGTSTDSIVEFHSPKKATIMSALLPGLGQIYNKKWWKVPIIYGGFATAGYFLNDNLENIDRYKTAYVAATDDNPNTVNNTGFNTTQLLKNIDTYKQWRDLAYISIVVIYALNIIDANVDAHLFYFNVSEDISLNVQPYLSPFHTQGAGLTLALRL